jgi:DNA-binding NarL/FixJ family response regulator
MATTSQTPLRILVADDHTVVRRGLVATLVEHRGWHVVAEAANGREAVSLAEKHRPDLVILDITMPELNGLEAARQIRKAVPRAEILVLTMHDSEQLVREVLATGARGYVLKNDASRVLVQAVETLAQHRPFFTSKVSALVLAGFLKPAPAAPSAAAEAASRLTPREREVLQLVAEGKANKQIADALGLGVKTVETHRTNLMRKLRLHTASDLTRYAIRNRIIEA